jgi:hypothetical protein
MTVLWQGQMTTVVRKGDAVFAVWFPRPFVGRERLWTVGGQPLTERHAPYLKGVSTPRILDL